MVCDGWYFSIYASVWSKLVVAGRAELAEVCPNPWPMALLMPWILAGLLLPVPRWAYHWGFISVFTDVKYGKGPESPCKLKYERNSVATTSRRGTSQNIPLFDCWACFYTSLWFALSAIQNHVARLPSSRKAEAPVEKDVAADEAANGGTTRVPNLIWACHGSENRVPEIPCYGQATCSYIFMHFPNVLVSINLEAHPSLWIYPYQMGNPMTLSLWPYIWHSSGEPPCW